MVEPAAPAPSLDEGLRGHLVAGLDRDPVVAARLFGSRTAGSTGPPSDIDVGVWLHPRLAPGDRLEAQLALGRLLEDAARPDRVDLVVLNDAPPLLQHRALRAGVMLLVRDPRLRVRLEASAMVEFLDTAPLRESSRGGCATGWPGTALVDPEGIHDRLQRLDSLLGRLEKLRAAGEAPYLADPDTRLKGERALQLALQVCIDVGAHLVGERGLGPPDTYVEVFVTLRDAGIIEPDLAGRLGEATRLRNLLVHGYADLDDRKVWAALDHLEDLRAFAAVAARLADED